MIKDFLSGIQYFFKGFALALNPKIRPYVIIPLLINFVLFAVLIWLSFQYLNSYIDAMIPEWLKWEFVRAIIAIILGVGLVIMSSFAFVMVANLIAAPFNAILAEKTELLLRGTPPPSSGRISSFIKSYFHAIGSQISKIFYMMTRAIPLLILFWIPVVNFIAPVLWMLFSAWMQAIEYIDYPAGNHEILFKKQKQLLSAKRGASLGFGSMAMLFTTVPILNLLVMPISVIAMTALYVEKLNATDSKLD